MSRSPSFSELSEDYSHYSDYDGSTVSVQSTLAELLERFTIDAQPECTLKLRSKAGPVVVGADITRITGAKSTVGALVLKPSNSDQMWRRLRIDNTGTLTLRSRKLTWWLFTLDVIGHANPLTRTFDLSYRVATKWDVTKGEYRNKKRFEVSPNAEARAHWSISYSLPAIEGSMGTAARRVSREVHADVGYAHLDIPRLELVVWPRGKPGEPGSGSSSSSGGSTSMHAESSNSGEAASNLGAGSLAPAPALDMVAAAPAPVPAAAAVAAAAAGEQYQYQRQQQQQREYLPDYLRGGAGGAGSGAGVPPSVGGGGGGGSGSPGGAGRRASRLQQLNSHVASLSGRWWDTVGSGNKHLPATHQ